MSNFINIQIDQDSEHLLQEILDEYSKTHELERYTILSDGTITVVLRPLNIMQKEE